MEKFEELLELKIIEHLKNSSDGDHFKFSGETFNIFNYNNINDKLKELGSRKRVIAGIKQEKDIMYGETQEAIAPDGNRYTEFKKIIHASDGLVIQTSEGLKATIYEISFPGNIFLINETIEQSYDKIKHFLFDSSKFSFYENFDERLIPIVQEIIKNDLEISSESDWCEKKKKVIPMLKNFEYFHGKAHHQLDEMYNNFEILTKSPLISLCKEFYADFAEKNSVVEYMQSLNNNEIKKNLAAYIAVNFDGMFLPTKINKDIRHAVEIPFLYFALKNKDSEKTLAEMQKLVNARIIYLPLQEIFDNTREIKNDHEYISILKEQLKKQEDSILEYIKKIKNLL